jgi:adenylate cyclase class 2
MEIEIKVNVQNSANLLQLLKQEGALKYTDKQIDEYYTPAHRNFTSVAPVVEWLRLRDSNGTFSINYKHWIIEPDGTSNHCTEYETKIENIEAMRNILKVLNFEYLVVVNKERSAWDYKDYEISFDTVEGLGDFVEIEYKGEDSANPKKITDEMMTFLETVGCGKITRDFKGYPYLLLEKAGLLKSEM